MSAAKANITDTPTVNLNGHIIKLAAPYLRQHGYPEYLLPFLKKNRMRLQGATLYKEPVCHNNALDDEAARLKAKYTEAECRHLADLLRR